MGLASTAGLSIGPRGGRDGGPRDRVVVVTGATGRQGRAVARRLLSEGWRVRAITRRPESRRARDLAAFGADVVGADMAVRETLSRAFRDAYGVFSVQNPMISGVEGEIQQGRNVADAARESGVRHLVYGSAGTGHAAPASAPGSPSSRCRTTCTGWASR